MRQQSWYAIVLLTLGHFLSDFYANFLPALLPAVMTNLNLSLTTSGLLVMAFSFSSNIIQPVFGFLIDKYGYSWLILVTLPVSAIFICISGFSPNTFLLFSSITLAGVAISLFHPLSSSLVNIVIPDENKGKAMSIFIAGGNLGFALAPASIIYFLYQFGIPAMPWLIIPGILATILYHQAGLHRLVIAKAGPATLTGSAWYKSADVIKLNIVMSLRSWPQVAVLTFLPVLLAAQGHSPTLAAKMLTVFLLSGAIGGFIGGYISDRFGCKNCIISSLVAALLPLYVFLESPAGTATSWLSLAVCGAALQSTVPSSIVWAQRILPANAAMVSGMMLGLTFGLGGVGAAITGAIADAVGLHAALLWTLLPLGVAIPLSYCIKANEPLQKTRIAKLS